MKGKNKAYGLILIGILLIQAAFSMTQTEKDTWSSAIEFLASELKEPLYYYDTKEIQTTTLNFEKAKKPNMIYVLDKNKRIIYDEIGQHANFGKEIEFIPEEYFETKELAILERNNVEYFIRPVYEKEELQGYAIIGIEKEKTKEPISLAYLFISAIIAIILLTILKKHNIIKIDRQYTMVLFGTALILIIGVFVFNAYQIARNMEQSSISSFQEQQKILAEQIAQGIEHDIEIMMDDMEVTANDPALLTEKKIIEQMQKRLAGFTENSYLLDMNGTIMMSTLPRNERHYETGGITKEPAISEVYELTKGKKGFTITMPIINENEQAGALAVNVLLSTIIEKYLKPMSITNAGQAHLITGGQMYSLDGNSLPAKQEITKDIYLGKANSIIRQQTYFQMENTETTEAIATYHPISMGEQNWAVALIAPKQKILTSISESINRIWGFTLGMVASIVIVGVTFDYLFTRSLRREIAEKTHALNTTNIRLEKTVQKRTKELNFKSAQLEKLNTGLEKEIDKKTKEIAERLKKEEKATKAMVYLLEKQKQAKELIEIKNVQVNQQATELKTTNLQLRKTQKALEEEKSDIEKKVESRTKELKKANNKIKKLLHVKLQFVNQVAHDLRTPLTPISGLLPVIKQRVNNKLDKKDTELLNIVINNTKYLAALVQNTLSISRLDSGKIEFEFKPAQIEEIINEVIEDNSVVFKEKNIKIINKTKKKLPPVLVDRMRIREVLENLITNSIKFLTEKKKELAFDVTTSNNQLIIAVKDTGRGIEKQHLTKIFEEFCKIDQARHSHSSGLGLSICKRIIKKHRGKIWAESEGLGKGATMKFTIPMMKNKK